MPLFSFWLDNHNKSTCLYSNNSCVPSVTFFVTSRAKTKIGKSKREKYPSHNFLARYQKQNNPKIVGTVPQSCLNLKKGTSKNWESLHFYFIMARYVERNSLFLDYLFYCYTFFFLTFHVFQIRHFILILCFYQMEHTM